MTTGARVEVYIICFIQIFSDSLLSLNQFDILSNSLFIMEVRVFRSLCLKNKLVSFAKMKNVINFDELTILLMYMIKSSGPRMDSWGTPHVIDSRVEFTSLT